MMSRRAVALSFALSVLTATSSWAQVSCSFLVSSGGCTCAAAIGAASGLLGGIGGDVKKSGAGGYSPINAETGLTVGDGVLLGDDGKAALSAGPECQPRSLGPQTSVSVSQVGGCACFTVVENQVPPPPPDGGGAALAAAAAVGVGAGVYLLTRTGSPASP